ncbi:MULTISPECIES: hypothetical protein [unclassified Pseudomonas]|nr:MULTISPECIES: hypothetical protein [unclassified Pseudomonas]MCU1724485.1 hypothetical protein [Pseudomonas sp. 5P_5.1_Bac1]MCU1732951.1 hypothetical protein [Pseudomonas sp. 20P_3.2_Bac4]MCU1744057.1 hypothetical protein [Pseudomonas sp. 20P_3.2_Bac5]
MSDMSMEFEVLDAQTIKLEVPYWLDRHDESGVARLIVKEDEISGGAKW